MKKNVVRWVKNNEFMIIIKGFGGGFFRVLYVKVMNWYV